MAANKTLSLGEMPAPARAAYERLRAEGRAVSGPVARSGETSAESTTRFAAQRGGDEAAVDSPLKHAEPCTYHVTSSEHVDRVTTIAGAEKLAPSTNAGDRGVQAMHLRHEAERYMLRNDYVSALDAMRQALEREGSARNEALYAWILHLSTTQVGGRVHPRAWEHIERATERGPNDEDAHFYHAMLLKHAGRQDDAYQVFRRVLRINPKHQGAAREVRLWEMRARPRGDSGFMARVLGFKAR